jgi:hypothetical protein
MRRPTFSTTNKCNGQKLSHAAVPLTGIYLFVYYFYFLAICLEVLVDLEVKATVDWAPRFWKAIGRAASSSTTVPVRETSPPALDRQLILQEIFLRKRVWIK